jgi:hypothetical protein
VASYGAMLAARASASTTKNWADPVHTAVASRVRAGTAGRARDMASPGEDPTRRRIGDERDHLVDRDRRGQGERVLLGGEVVEERPPRDVGGLADGLDGRRFRTAVEGQAYSSVGDGMPLGPPGPLLALRPGRRHCYTMCKLSVGSARPRSTDDR